MEELQNPISRRRMLKRVGAGAAIAWSAPILSSLRTPAFAQAYPARCVEPCDATCGTFPRCGESGPIDQCFCSRASDGSCFCWEDASCTDIPRPDQAGRCPEGTTAVPETCCGGVVCLSECGTNATGGGVTTGPTASGR
jgi:hypothetical protein